MTASQLENNWQKYCLHITQAVCCVVCSAVERMTEGRALRQWHLGSRIVFADSPPQSLRCRAAVRTVSAHFHRSAGGCPQSSLQWCHKQADNCLLLNLVIEKGFISIVFYILSPCSLLLAVCLLASLLWCPRCVLVFVPIIVFKSVSLYYHCIHFGRSFIVWICLALGVSSI